MAFFAIISLLPESVGAFWPFSIASGAEGDNETPILHDETLPLLKAAVNVDPNPTKGGVDIAMSEGSALIANSGPSGTLPYRESGLKNGQISIYTVREGDSVSEIADMFGVSVNTILWANDVKSAKLISPGMELLILPVSGVQHKVGKGETLAGIAKKYGADKDEVALYNGLESGAALAAGETIVVPGGEVQKTIAKSSSGTVTKSSGGSALPALSGYFGNPLPGGRLTQGIHGYNAVDIGAPNGTPIYASAGGTIIVAKSGGGYNGGYGNYIVIKHDNGTQTLYAHMSSLAVSGGTVEKGELIGYVGISGRATGYHLHFEVRGAKNPLAR
ncbi:MAG: peptidoglycan DD-metalloendopeptidase family protein [Patescibacteria group bacterium]